MKPVWIFMFAWLLCSCQSEDPYDLNLPDHFPEYYSIPERNPLSKRGVELGRMLFYDPILSSDGKTSCNSCHRQDLAFTDGETVSSNGVSGKKAVRNSPTLANVLFQEYFFWDGGVHDLESQVFAPLMHDDEMGSDLQGLIDRLNSHDIYPALFKTVFGSDSITSASVARALAQFQRVLISGNSRYDQFVSSGDETLFNETERRGLTLFKEHCSSCHTPPLFTDGSFHNNDQERG
jgi:cytochrome c peroxidase